MADYATLLRDHVTLKVRAIDRIFLQGYVPKLQSVGQVCTFLRWQKGFHIPSSAAFGKLGEQFVKQIERFASEHEIPVVHFKKGENKEERARPLLEAAAGEGGEGRVVLIGIAQEKASAWRSWKAKGQEKAAHPHMEWGRQMAFVNHYYFYLWDPEWGPAFWKTNAYAPYPIWLWLNGLKEGRALRTETVICNTRDFGVGRRVCAKNWNALRAVGEGANRRLCDAEAQDAMPAPDVVTFQHVTRPSTSEDGLYAPGLRFGDSRVMAVLAALVGFCNLVQGFTNAQLVEQASALLNTSYTPRQATYDLRRLRRKGLVRRIPKAHRYELTPVGRRVAVLFTKAYGRVLAPGLAILDPGLPDDIARRSPLATAWRALEHAIDDFLERGLDAA